MIEEPLFEKNIITRNNTNSSKTLSACQERLWHVSHIAST